MDTWLLDLTNWDLTVDAAGNWATASSPYATAQDVASAVKLFSGELFYDTSKGIPYFAQILGHTPPSSLFQQYMIEAALTVPNVVASPPPVCTILGFTDRTVQGAITFTDDAGNSQTVTLQ